MKVIDIINNINKPFISFELVPPLKGSDMTKLHKSIEPLMEFKPPFLNVTYHRDEIVFRPNPDGSFKKVTLTKRPSSIAIVAAILNRFEVEIVPHLICGGIPKQKLENDLMDLYFLDIHNVMILRGDTQTGQKRLMTESTDYKYSSELVQQIAGMNSGKYLDDEPENNTSTDFCIGIAGYPEKHYEAPNLETDIQNLKKKVEAGADYIITQMFFDNKKYFRFVEKCRKTGILVPIIPGLKPISTYKHIELLPQTFNIDIPEELMGEIRKCKNDSAIYTVGIEWCIQQTQDLLKSGAPAIHYYTMGKADNVKQVIHATF